MSDAIIEAIIYFLAGFAAGMIGYLLVAVMDDELDDEDV
jgi:hypothetical protein